MSEKIRPTSFDVLFPGRFIDAPMLKDRTVTISIAGVYQEEPPSGQKEPLNVIEIEGRDKEWSINKTNSRCLRAMFGDNPQEWVGRRVAIFPTTCESFGEIEDCIRIEGSPDIDKPVKVKTYKGRKKVTLTMKKTGGATGKPKTGGGAENEQSNEQYVQQGPQDREPGEEG